MKSITKNMSGCIQVEYFRVLCYVVQTCINFVTQLVVHRIYIRQTFIWIEKRKLDCFITVLHVE